MAKTLADYKAELKELERKITARREKNNKLAGEISRLETAYNKMGQIKRHNDNNADKVRDDTKLKKVAKDVEWKGKLKDQFDAVMDDSAPPAASDFFNSIDEMHDEIGRALSNKRSEYDTGSSILNGLNRSWNAVSSTIRNWIN